jgi:RNA polymerase sigma factor (sigma-70 family)
MDDTALLQEYVERRSERAFAELVERYINLVYSTALRIVRETDLAKDVCQSAFIQLAAKAPTIRSGDALAGWLYRVTRCLAANAVRDDRTRREYEMEALNMTRINAESSAVWEFVLPQLDDAMQSLDDNDQDAIVQRFFQGRSWREVGAALALSEDAAQKRVSRALEKLRQHLVRRGVTVTIGALSLAIAANAVQAAPAGLASAIATASLAGTGGAGATVASTTLKLMLMKKTTIGILASLAVFAAVLTPIAISKTKQAQLNGPVTEKNLRRGLVLHLTCDKDETGLGKITDASGAGNHGRPEGVKWTADGKRGGAYEFTADGNEIVVANNKSVNPGQLTLSAWIKTSYADGMWRRIFDKSYSKGYALSIAGDWEKSNWRGLASTEIGPGTHFILTKTRVTDGQWHHVVTTFNGTEEVLYVDGLPQSRLQWKGPGEAGTTDFNLVIGCNRSNLNENDLGTSFRGCIDEPMMWNRALSEKEVTFLFESQGGPAPVQSAAN